MPWWKNCGEIELSRAANVLNEYKSTRVHEIDAKLEFMYSIYSYQGVEGVTIHLWIHPERGLAAKPILCSNRIN